jgi:hypothetical protein
MKTNATAVALRTEDPEEIEAEAGRRSKVMEIPEGAEWNAVEDVMLRRRSIRKYKRRQVPAHVIRRLLEVARYAPSQGNCQPWKFVVVRDADMIQGMEDFCVEACRKLSRRLDYFNYPKGTVKHFITRSAAKLFNRLQPNQLHPIPVAAMTAIAQGRFAVFHRAPTLILLLVDKRGIGTRRSTSASVGRTSCLPPRVWVSAPAGSASPNF